MLELILIHPMNVVVLVYYSNMRQTSSSLLRLILKENWETNLFLLFLIFHKSIYRINKGSDK